MLPPRSLVWLLLGLCAWVLCVDAQQSHSAIPTRSRRVRAAHSSISKGVEVFSTTIQSFPTEIQTKTISSWSLNPTETGVFEYEPLFANETSKSVSFSLQLGSNIVALCWYPISGQYGLLPRILFYVTVLAALVLRHHQWLYAGALVSALTYSGVAAIHACLLIWRGPATGELDLVALVSILSLSCLVTVPLLNWSSTLRNIGKNENEIRRSSETRAKQDDEFDAVSRTIVLYWGFLVTVGFLCVFIALQNAAWTFLPKWWDIIALGGESEIRCSPQGGLLNMTAGQSTIFGSFVVDTEFANANHCTDPCATVFDREAIFRSPGDAMLIDEARLVRFLGEGTKRQQRNDAFASVYLSFGLISVPYILLQGFWAALFGRRTPAQARNVIYALLTRLRFSRKRTQLDPASPFQRWLAKFCAMLSYLWAVFISVICIPMVIVNILAIELFLHTLPEGEQPTHIGAWGPWAATGVAIFAAFFGRYNEDIKYGFFMTIYKAAWVAAHPSWPFLMLSQGLRSNVEAKNIFTGSFDTMPDRELYRNATKKVVGSTYGKSNNYIAGKISWFFRAVSGEWRQFREFWRDPEYSRANQGRVHRLEINDCKCLMKCSCPVKPECRHDSFCEPDHKCPHDPKCKHTRACRREKRIRLLNPERVGVNMAISQIHGHRFQLDVTGKPIPLRDMGGSLIEPTRLYPMGTTDYASIRSDTDSDNDEKSGSEIPLPHSHQQQTKRSSTPGRLSRLFGFGRKSMASTKPGARGLVAQILQPRGGSFERPSIKQKSGGVIVREDPVHPALRSTYHDSYHSRQSSGETNNVRPSIYSVNEAELLHNRQPSRNDQPPTPSDPPPRVPYTTPNDQSPASPAEASDPVSPVQTRSNDPTPGSQAQISDRPSPDSQTDSNSSTTSGLVSPQSNPSPPRPALQKRLSQPPPTHIVSQLRSSSGLTSSFEQAIMSRQRRSAAYSPADAPSNPSNLSYNTPSASQMLSLPPNLSRADLTNSSSAPIPVHMETLTPFAEAPGDESYFSHDQTPSDLAASMPFSPSADPELDTSSSALLPPSLPPTPPPKNTPPPGQTTFPAPEIKHRHTLPTALQVRAHPTLPMPKALNLDPITLSPTRAEDSKASTPAIMLPLLSPAHPDSNTAFFQRGDLHISLRSPHMVTPATGAGGPGQGRGVRAPLSVAGSRIQSLEGVQEEYMAQTRALEGAIQEGVSAVGRGGAEAGGGAIERTRSPRPPGYRSTVSYLQVQRPETTMFADEITLRKDEFGVYRLVVNGEDVVDE